MKNGKTRFWDSWPGLILLGLFILAIFANAIVSAWASDTPQL
ncbi:hypothetical protein [uncultured Gilvimarinus sp.]